jgi:ligand-binding sensor domain-containing protein
LVEGIDEDNNGNLWLLNRAAQFPIVKFLPEPCIQYPVPANQQATTIIFLDIDNYNTKWITFPNDVPGTERGIVYFNESVTPTGTIIRAPQLGSDIDAANHLVVDKNSEVWVATNNGVAVIRDPYQVIANPGSIPAIEKMRIIENGISTPLTDNVQVIGVDPLNNKWLGTYANGLLYVSSDGSTLLERYNMSNSPLPDNRILSIMIDPKTGLAYFGTSKGLVSYQTIAVEPLSRCDDIKVRPSPFVIPSNKSLLIDGLVAESSIKILTISGTLVAEFEAPGGRVATWDGRDLNGSYVSSGIYIVAGYNKDASEVCTGKIAVVRR